MVGYVVLAWFRHVQPNPFVRLFRYDMLMNDYTRSILLTMM